MKKTAFSVFVFILLGIFLGSCSTDVDLYADYKHITVVYGLLDYKKDTNYIKINKAFLGPGNALDIALIADSCNYPTKLDSKIIEYKANVGSNNFQKTRELTLDTITIHNKEQGIFYAPDQLVYFIKDRINTNSKQYKYKYELQIDRGDTLLTSTTDVVGGDAMNIVSSVLNFSPNTDLGSVRWTPFPNAAVYEIIIKFHWSELLPGHDTAYRTMTWSLGTFPESSLIEESGQYSVSYKTENFFTTLASYLGADTLNPNYDRIVTDYPLTISIAAGGVELYNFISVNGPTSSIVQTIPEYTNINGGYGVFSSRNFVEKKNVRMSSQGFTELVHRNWKFRQG